MIKNKHKKVRVPINLTCHWRQKLYTNLRLEQLERLRSENTPHRPMITHTIDSYQIPSQKNMERM